MTAKRIPIEWRAGADQISHAFEGGRRPGKTTLCGLRVVDQRLAWPPVVKCPDCQSATGQKGVAA